MGGIRPTSPRALEFARRYLEILNATQAAIDVGYSATSARYRGARLLKHPEVQKVIKEEMASRAERSRIAVDRIIEELAPLALSNITHYEIDPMNAKVTLAAGAPASAMRAVSSIKHTIRVDKAGGVTKTTELKLWDKNSALDKAMSHLGLIRKRHEHTGKDGDPLPSQQVHIYIPDNHRDSTGPAALPGNRLAEQLTAQPAPKN